MGISPQTHGPVSASLFALLQRVPGWGMVVSVATQVFFYFMFPQLPAVSEYESVVIVMGSPAVPNSELKVLANNICGDTTILQPKTKKTEDLN